MSYNWIDSLSAYYPGLLALAGELDEAISTHLLYTALWNRYSAMPERWNTITGNIDNGIRWWPGRPEFIESTWYLYRATRDPWYLHVGEMVMKDIKRRCFTECGWAGLQDVRTGEQTDRMESFFLGETAKYLYLLYDPDHPLNNIDAPVVFTTEGHPLIIPSHVRKTTMDSKGPVPESTINQVLVLPPPQCPLPPEVLPFTVSATAARPDVYHAAALARLHLVPRFDMPDSLDSPTVDYAEDHPSISLTTIQSPSNWTYFPWTLPPQLIPHNATSAPMVTRQTFDLTFPALSNNGVNNIFNNLARTDDDSLLITSFSGLRVGLELEPAFAFTDGVIVEEVPALWRVYAVGNNWNTVGLGRDERVYLSPQSVEQIDSTDEHFLKKKDLETVDLVIDAPDPLAATLATDEEILGFPIANLSRGFDFEREGKINDLNYGRIEDSDEASEILRSWLELGAFATARKALRKAGRTDELLAVDEAVANLRSGKPASTKPLPLGRYTIPAMLPTGVGAAQPSPTSDPSTRALGALPYSSIFVLDDPLCDPDVAFPNAVAKTYQVVVVRRGGCSFSDKIARIPSFAPTQQALQLVVAVSFPEHEDAAETLRALRGETTAVRPLLDRAQVSSKGNPRRTLIPLVLVGGGDETWDLFERAASAVGRVRDGRIVVERRDEGASKGAKGKKGKEERSGLGVKRKFWFASQGVRIGNLFVQ